MIRSILAVAAGFVIWTVLWVGAVQLTSITLPGYFVDDTLSGSTGILLLLLGLSVTASVIAGFATASIAGYEEIKHTTTLGASLLIVGIYLQTTFWASLPPWYHVGFAAFLLPGALLGGRIRIEQRAW